MSKNDSLFVKVLYSRPAVAVGEAFSKTNQAALKLSKKLKKK
jgi:hypothetical protein